MRVPSTISAPLAFAVAAFTLIPLLHARPARPLANADGCSGTANYDLIHMKWYISCSGNSCGANNDQPCSVGTGGVPGANFTFCGCPGADRQTPICCYATVESDGSPSTNGFCAGQIPQASGCGNPPCSLVGVEPFQNQTKMGSCTGS